MKAADPMGVFEIGHIPAGDWNLRVAYPGMAVLDAKVSVAGGEVTTVDFELAEGPLVSGVVVDELGEPLSGVRVHSIGNLDAWSDVSDERGRFDVRLPSSEPHEIRARSAHHEHALRRKILARAGEENLRIVMRPSMRCMLRVVDDADGSPIEFFWLAVERGGTAERAGELEGRPDPRVHEGGRVTRHARPGHDWVTVIAPDFLEDRFAIESGSQELRLRRGPALTGRLHSRGVPVPGAALRLHQQERLTRRGEHDRIAGRSGKHIQPDVRFVDADPPRRDPRLAAGKRRIDSRTDTEGYFYVTGIEPGRWRFLARPLSDDEGMAAYAVDIEVGEESIDLGDIELTRSSTIVGRLVLDDETRLAGHRLSIEGVKRAVSDTNGCFVLERVPPGDIWLDVQPGDDVVAAPQRFFLRTKPGETRQVELEIPDHPGVRPRIILRMNGEPLEGNRTLRFTPLSHPENVLHVRAHFDGAGQATLALPELGPSRVELELDGTELRASELVRLTRDAVREAGGAFVLDFTSGAIELVFKKIPELPPTARLELRSESLEAPGVVTTLVRSIENGHVLGSEGIILDEWNDGLIYMEPVPTGTLDVTLLVVEGGTEAVLPGGFIRGLLVSPAGVTPLHLP